MNDVVNKLAEKIADECVSSFRNGDGWAGVQAILEQAYQAGADSVKAEAELINETVEQISGRREDEASNAMAQVMLLQFSRLTGKQTVSVTVDTDTIVDDLASTRLTKTAPSEHEMTYTLDVLP